MRQLSQTNSRILISVPAIIALIVVLLLIVGPLNAGGGDEDIDLTGIGKAGLEASGLQLKEPSGEPQISANDASAAALQQKPPGARVLETVLVRLINDVADPRVDRLAWAVNLDPSSVISIPLGGGPDFSDPDFRSKLEKPAGCSSSNPTFDVMFIDAQTGDFISGLQRSGKAISRGGECPSPGPEDIQPTERPAD